MREELNRKEFHEAINTTLSGLQADPWLYQRVAAGLDEGEVRVKRKVTTAMIFAAILIIVTMGIAFALTNGFGILDFVRVKRPNVEVPENAEQYIEHDLDVVETEHFTVSYREASYDGKTCHIVYDVIPKSKEQLLFDKPLDEYWYGQTHLDPDPEKMLEDGRTILDRWDEGGYTNGWEVEIDVGSDTEDIRTYGCRGVLDEETGIYTGWLEVTFESLKEERTLWFSARMLPLMDMHDENSEDYDHEEHGYMKKTFQAAVSGEEVVLVNTNPVLFSTIGVQVDHIRLMILPQEIQYQIDYSLTDADLYHSLFDEYPDAEHTITVPPFFRFITVAQSESQPVILPSGISNNEIGYDIDEEKGLFRQTGSLGRSCFADTYTLGAYRDVYADSSIPLETATFRVDVQNPDTFTSEERVWQQESDQSKPHNETIDTFVNPVSDDLSEEEAIAIAKQAILKAYELSEDALSYTRIVADMYVTRERPDYHRWLIQFQVLKEGTNDYVVQNYSCIVDCAGNVIADPDINEKSIFEYAQKERLPVVATYNTFVMEQAGGRIFQYWPIDLKATFSDLVLPEVNAITESGNLELLVNGGDIDYDLIAIAMHRYGVPQKTDISIDRAYQIAVSALIENYNIDSSIIELYDAWYYSYDITDVSNPKWCIVFWPSSSSAALFPNGFSSGQGHIRYRVEIDAVSGTIVNMHCFDYHPTDKSLSYLSNLY